MSHQVTWEPLIDIAARNNVPYQSAYRSLVATERYRTHYNMDGRLCVRSDDFARYLIRRAQRTRKGTMESLQECARRATESRKAVLTSGNVQG